MYEMNQYMNELLDKATVDSICEMTASLPDDIGKIHLKKEQLRHKITFFNWNMSFVDNISVKRKGGLYKDDEIQLIFNLNQNICWKIEDNGQLVEMKKGEMCLYRNVGMTTSMCYTQRTGFLFKSIQIPTEYFRKTLFRYFSVEQIKILEYLFLKKITKTKITSPMYRILYEIEQADEFGEFRNMYLEGKVTELLSVVLHNIAHAETKQILRTGNLSKEEIGSIRKIKEQIERYPEQEYLIDDIARKVGMSATKLTRCFAQLYGMAIHSYVIDKRLEQATMLLSERQYSVSEVAVMSGYNNLSHFSNSFRKKYGVLPKYYSRNA